MKKKISVIVLLLWASIMVFLLGSLYFLNWGEGIIRAKIIIAIFLFVLVYWFIGRLLNLRLDFASQISGRISLFIFCLGVLFHMVLGIKTMLLIYKTNEIPLDQGQINFRAVNLLIRKGENPYGVNAILDPISYSQAVGKIKGKNYCFVDKGSSLQKDLENYWKSPGDAKRSLLFPDYSLEGCSDIREKFKNFGYKYGPAMMLFYLPQILLLGKMGIIATHILLLLGLAIILWRISTDEETTEDKTLSMLISSIILFLTIHLGHNVFLNSATDLIPAFLISLFLYCVKKNNYCLLGTIAGIAVSTKLAPGVFLVPLLLQKVRKTTLPFLITVVIFNLPFILWDFRGFANNILIFNLIRPEDTTSLFYFLHPNHEFYINFLSVIVLFFFYLILLIKKWKIEFQVLFLIVVTLLSYLNSKAFHNNYLLWLLPLLSIYVPLVSSKSRGIIQK